MLQHLSIDEVKALQHKDTTLLFIDVREDDEWEHGHIDGALHCPLSQLDDYYDEIITKAATHTIVLYCARGARSALAGERLLLSHPSLSLINMAGGFMEWSESL